MRKRDVAEIERGLRLLSCQIAESPATSSLVLDDVDFSPGATNEIEDLLGELLAIIKGRQGRLLITSRKPLPSRLQHTFGLDPLQILAIPNMSKEEIADLARKYGCPDDASHQVWMHVVFVRTSGHRSLPRRISWSLKQKGWPEFSGGALRAGADEISAEQAGARQLLEELPDSQRVLLHRLSVFPRVFRRDHAVEVAAKPSALPAPGDLFDPLVGPWIEPLHAGYFELTPLLE